MPAQQSVEDWADEWFRDILGVSQLRDLRTCDRRPPDQVRPGLRVTATARSFGARSPAAAANLPVAGAVISAVAVERDVSPPAKKNKCVDSGCCDGVRLRLCRRPGAGAVLTHCIAVITQLTQKPGTAGVVFKIGVCKTPAFRWSNAAYGYKHDADHYREMLVLAETRSSEAAGFLEAALIERFQSVPGCRNDARGGDGLKCLTEVSHYIYVVYKHLALRPEN